MRTSFIFSLFLLIISCTESDEPEACVASFDYEICLIIEKGAVSADATEGVIDEISNGIIRIQQAMPVDRLDIRIVDEPSLVIAGQAAGGFNPSASEINIAIRKNASHDDIKDDLIPIVAHEIHHVIRRRSIGYGSTLLEAIISEGLADHFALEITGNPPYPWSLALDESELETWTEIARDVWNQPSYNHNAWFFGADGNIPPWAGYAIGHYLVEQYLNHHPNVSAAELHNTAAVHLVE